MIRHRKNKSTFLPAFFITIFIIGILLYSFNRVSSNTAYLNILCNSIPGFNSIGKNNNSSYVASSSLVHNDSAIKMKFNPFNFMQYSFFGFSQIMREKFDISKDISEIGLLDIESYSDVPEGEIYFSEEDEYKAYEEEGQVKKTEEIFQNIEAPRKLALTKKIPEVLIYHSHATESYTPYSEGNYHTLNEKHSVILVGSIMAKNLQDKYKYIVVHDKTYHDKESYAYSYINSLATIKQQTTKNRSLKVFLDIHRDAFTVNNNEHKKVKKDEYTTTINGKKAARIMLVTSSANPNYSELKKFSAYISKKMEKLYPGLYLKTDIKTRSKYNQYVSDYCILIEVGCMLNTIDEAAYSGELLSNVIGEVLKDLQE
ncbi:MAG: stage II sporulation protein P [Firmicutes bacterium]|nr:stage II sporulation protein P [Bacillota bacterium]